VLGIGMARAALARLRPPWPECVGWVWWATYYVITPRCRESARARGAWVPAPERVTGNPWPWPRKSKY